ncbi:MAG: ketoacyl-ACP synthase III, partial [Candidatus Sumerlaeota bacterium]|nr:ketoacyl-ACP synthase III [Candidatus Sumerlaeota bacterium]
SDYGAQAARIAIERAGVKAGQIDLIVCATFTPDEWCPSTACRIQHKLALKGMAAFDLNAACTGFVYALSVAKQMIAGGMARHALVVGADMNSAFVDYQDRSTCVLFGDAAGAAVVGPVAKGRGILSEYLAADGSAGDLIMIPSGGSKRPASAETVANREHYLRMSGNDVFKFAVRTLSEAVESALAKTPFTANDLDLLAPHQANIRIIEAAAKRFGMPMERVLCNIERYGNTSAATIPVLLAEAEAEGKLKDDHLIALVAFGAGMTWGSAIVRWGR